MERRDTRTSLRGAQFVDPSALARIRNLELLARTVVDGFINGLHRAPHLGFSLDFAEHRAYEPGDDLRRSDEVVHFAIELVVGKELPHRALAATDVPEHGRRLFERLRRPFRNVSNLPPRM